MASARGNQIRVSLDEAKILGRYSEFRVHDLSIGRLVPLPGGLCADQEAHGPVVLKPDLGAIGWRAQRHFEVA